MKSLAMVSVLFVSAAALAADNPLPGKWRVHNSIAGNECDMTCTWTQKDADLTGTFSSDQGSGAISGKVDGKKIGLTYKSEYNGSPVTLTYTGTMEAADKIAGYVNVEEYGVEGGFTATAAK